MIAQHPIVRGSCPVCAGVLWTPFLATATGRVMTSDQRVIEGSLRKVQCSGCGVVANERPFTPDELCAHYGSDYALNRDPHEEHVFFTDHGPTPRSSVYFDWISPHLPPRCESVLEIGCGAGNLLQRIRAALPHCEMHGVDGSDAAVDIARARGLDVRQSLVTRESELPRADAILAMCVLEHVEDVAGFLGSLCCALRPGGRIILALPLQGNGGYDVFFHDHVWHFDVRQVEALLRRQGLTVVACEPNHPVNHQIGLFVCAPADEGDAEALTPARHSSHTNAQEVRSDAAERNVSAWRQRLCAVDAKLHEHRPKRLAIFGAGEVLALYSAYTTLGEHAPCVVLDDDPHKIGGTRFGAPVHPTGWLVDHPVDAIVLATNPAYHERVRARLAGFVGSGCVF